ncbi:MAG TPA: SDR family oxidoreductase [Polyangiaceae bacterium]|jgi:nucleoside-diphosphate-sugar epimerase
MRVLFIGGTGNISASCSRLVLERGHELYLLNRGRRAAELPGARLLNADVNDEAAAAKVLFGLSFDAVANFIAFTQQDVERDLRLFADRTRQYLFVSSASAYQKPPASPHITESTPLVNPFWDYSRNKIACEERLLTAYRDTGFPVTIVRPSLTYDTVIPLPFASWQEWTLVDRMLRGERIVVHGDGTSLWTITHAQDFAVGFAGLLGNPQALGHAFHITSDELLTWDAIHQAVAQAAGTRAKIVHMASEDIVAVLPEYAGTLLGDKAHSAIFDNAKIRRFVPEFEPRIRFADGIRRTIAWFLAGDTRRVVSAESNAKLQRLLAVHDTRRADLIPVS